MTNFVLSPTKTRSQSTKTVNFVLSKPISQAESTKITNFVLSPTKTRSQSTKTAPNVLSTDPPTKISEIAREQNEDRKQHQLTHRSRQISEIE